MTDPAPRPHTRPAHRPGKPRYQLRVDYERALSELRRARGNLFGVSRALRASGKQLGRERARKSAAPGRIERYEVLYAKTVKMDQSYGALLRQNGRAIDSLEWSSDLSLGLAACHSVVAAGKFAELFLAVGKVHKGLKAIIGQVENLEKVKKVAGFAGDTANAVGAATRGQSEDASTTGFAAFTKLIDLLGTDVTVLADLLAGGAATAKGPGKKPDAAAKAGYAGNVIKVVKSLATTVASLIKLLKHETRTSVRLGALGELLGPLETIADLITSAISAYDEFGQARRLAVQAGHQAYHGHELEGWSSRPSHESIDAFEKAIFENPSDLEQDDARVLAFARTIGDARQARAWRQALLRYLVEAREDLAGSDERIKRSAEDYDRYAKWLPGQTQELAKAMETVSEAHAAYVRDLESGTTDRGWIGLSNEQVKRELAESRSVLDEASFQILMLHGLGQRYVGGVPN